MFFFSIFSYFSDLFLKVDPDQLKELFFAYLLDVTRKKNYLVWRKHTFFEKNDYAIFSSKTKFPMFVSHFFLYFRDLFSKSVSY